MEAVEDLQATIKKKLLSKEGVHSEDDFSLSQEDARQENEQVRVTAMNMFLEKQGIKNTCSRIQFMNKICQVNDSDIRQYNAAKVLFEACCKMEGEQNGNSLNDARQTLKDYFIDGEEVDTFEIIKQLKLEEY